MNSCQRPFISAGKCIVDRWAVAGSVAKAINMLYKDHSLRKTMSKNNRQIPRKFTREQVCLKMSEVLMAI